MTKEWRLSSFDLFSLNMTIKGAWIYREAPDYNKMKDALVILQGMYPLLGGKYHEKSKSLVWDDGQCETLPFTTCDLKAYSVDELVGDSKVWSLVKQYDVKGFKEGRTVPFSAVLATLKDGAILYVQCAHAAMDGATFYGLVEQWASLYRGEPVTQMTVDQSLIPAPDALSKEETVRQAQEMGWIQMGGRQLVKMLWNMVRNNHAKKTFTMEVPQGEIAALKEKSGAGTNAVLTAIALKSFSEHHRARKKYKLLFVADLRERISGIGKGFFGNLSQPVVPGAQFDPEMDLNSLVNVIQQSLTEAFASGKAGENVLLSMCCSHYGLPYLYFDPSEMNCTDPDSIYINNQLKFKACELDWGNGKPAYAFPNELTDMVKFWQPVSDGPVQIIFAGLAAGIMLR